MSLNWWLNMRLHNWYYSRLIDWNICSIATPSSFINQFLLFSKYRFYCRLYGWNIIIRIKYVIIWLNNRFRYCNFKFLIFPLNLTKRFIQIFNFIYPLRILYNHDNSLMIKIIKSSIR